MIRKIVSAFGSWRRITLSAYAGADPSRIRRRPLPRLPVRAPREGSRGRLLGLARGDTPARRFADGGGHPARVRRGLPRAAGERLYGRRRVPLPRARRSARRGRSGGRGGNRADADLRLLPAW